MPGDDWQKFANLRLLFGYMYAQPGKKLMFMGDEFAQWRSWTRDESLDWHLAEQQPHARVQNWVTALNDFYRNEPALCERDFHPAGFEWIDCRDAEQSVIVFLRKSRAGKRTVLAACNFTPVPRTNYRVGAPRAGVWKEVLNSDARDYGGSGWGNLGMLEAAPVPSHGRRFSLNLTLPPLAVVLLRHEA